MAWSLHLLFFPVSLREGFSPEFLRESTKLIRKAPKEIRTKFPFPAHYPFNRTVDKGRNGIVKVIPTQLSSTKLPADFKEKAFGLAPMEGDS